MCEISDAGPNLAVRDLRRGGLGAVSGADGRSRSTCPRNHVNAESWQVGDGRVGGNGKRWGGQEEDVLVIVPTGLSGPEMRRGL